MTRDVLVVGAGPVGLSVALGLARAGRSVLVLEQEAGTSEHSRAPAIWPRTQEVLAGLGVLERFLAEGIVLPAVEPVDADRERVLLRLPIEELADETSCPRLLILPQSDTERLLLEALRREGSAEVRFSSEVTGFSQDDAGVAVTCREEGGTERLEARYLVGCDGAHSTVRKALGLSFDGITYDLEAALADVLPAPSVPDLPFPRLTTRGVLAIGVRIDDRMWRLILPFRAGDPLPLPERVERAVSGLFSTSVYETVWTSQFRLHRRLSSRFVQGRVALAGDAAHLNSPVGGQGMNAGIQDSEALCRCLLRALAEDDPRALESYERERRESIEQGVNRFSDRLTRLFLAGGGRFLRPMLRLVRAALTVPPLRRRLLRRLTMLDTPRR